MNDTTASGSRIRSQLVFLVGIALIITAAVVRSSIATRLDSFTLDEAYHIGAGTAYVQTGDFRLNPEHPPLIKVWVGAFVSAAGYKSSPYRSFADKGDERNFVETDVYTNNDADLIQARARSAMFALNALLLFLFAISVRRVLGPGIALGATAILAIDPTVAAHFPVVMTDLPVALLSSSAVLLAFHAFRTLRLLDIVAAGLVLGLTLATKHSGVITLVAVVLIGMGTAWRFAAGWSSRGRRLGAVVPTVLLAMVVLWGFYAFRFAESPMSTEEQFNRTLAEKIGDVTSPTFRTALGVMSTARLFPRAYTWGMADTIRAGAEGNASSILLFGRLFYSKGPFYYFPGVLAVKLPIGIIGLVVIGCVLLLRRRVPGEWYPPILCAGILAILFLAALVNGSSYAGVRHALPVIPPLALLGAVPIYFTFQTRSWALRTFVGLCLVGTLISAVPIMRPWEYYNEFVGGTANGHLYFSDEGVDLGLRTRELADYYNDNLRSHGEIPFVVYFSPDLDKEHRGLDWVGRDMERDAEKLSADTQTGTFIIGGKEMAPSLFWDVGKPFREAVPVARFGNLFVYKGTFSTRSTHAASLFFRAVGEMYAPEPDRENAIRLLDQSLELDPSTFFVWLELGNQCLVIGDRDRSRQAYQHALDTAPAGSTVRALLSAQLERIRSEPLDQISPLRNPGLE
jgi:hypothetical protein